MKNGKAATHQRPKMPAGEFVFVTKKKSRPGFRFLWLNVCANCGHETIFNRCSLCGARVVRARIRTE